MCSQVGGYLRRILQNTIEEARLRRPSREAAAKEQQQHGGAAHDAAEVAQQRLRQRCGCSCEEKGGRATVMMGRMQRRGK
jgi:hypothetical protein